MKKIDALNGDMKPCSACGVVKHLSAFWRQATGPLGYNSRCKDCLRSSREANKEKLTKAFHDYYVSHRAAIRVSRQQYRAATSEKRKALRKSANYKLQKAAWDRASYARHAESRKAKTRLYACAHADKSSAWKRDYKAKKRDAFIETVRAAIVYERDMGLCQICGLPVSGDFHLDHRTALAHGGEHSYANCQTSHAVCNIRKSDKAQSDCAHLWMRS